MKLLVRLGCIWLVACSGQGAPARQPTTVSPPMVAPRVAEPRAPAPLVAPHGGQIDLERLAIRCGWGFGLYDRDVTAASNTPSACAAP